MNKDNTALDKMSDRDIDALIGKMCTSRKNNPELQIMDSIQRRQQSTYLPTEEAEAFDIQASREAIEADIVKDLFANSDQLSFEELNDLKAKGLYDKYINKTTEEDKQAMADITAEIMAGLAEAEQEEQLTEVISEEVTEEDATFQDSTEETVSTAETEGSDTGTEDTVREMTQEELEARQKKNIMSTVYGLPAAIALANNGENYVPMPPLPGVDPTKPITDEDTPDLDLPASELKVADEDLVKNLTNKYKDVSEQEALQLISVMNRYKAGEKFNVFEALPMSLKKEILKNAAQVNAGRDVVNFFAKSFINDLVNDTYLDKEIQDFNAQLKEVMAPMNNIVGTMMDEYSDDIYDKFTTGLREKADTIEAENADKAAELRNIADRFESACNLTDIVDTIVNNPGFINRAFKTGRDRWNDMQYEYATAIDGSKPEPKPLADCLAGIRSIGIDEDTAKTILYFVKKEIVNAIEEHTLSGHIYAYYMSNCIAVLKYSARNSKSYRIAQGALAACAMAINSQMEIVNSRKKKGKKKKK